MSAVYHGQLPLFPTKSCVICHTEKLLESDFYKSSSGKDGYENRCKVCRYDQERARKSRKPRKQRDRHNQTPESRKKWWPHYYAENREKVLEHRRIYNAEYRKAKKAETGLNASSLYYAKHPEQLPKKRARNRAWKKANLSVVAEQRRRREAIKRESTVAFVSYASILERDGLVCSICSRPIDLTIKNGPGRLHFDHVVPLARGGKHTQDNIKPSHAICNTRKGPRLMSELTDVQLRGPDV